VREGQWWAERALPRSKRERKGGRGRKHPLTCVSSEEGAVVGVSVDKGGGGGWARPPSCILSEGGGGGGCKSPLSLES